jgi:hypothetical protein
VTELIKRAELALTDEKLSTDHKDIIRDLLYELRYTKELHDQLMAWRKHY